MAEKTAQALRSAQGSGVISSPAEIKASLIFRLVACSCALVIRRAAKGSVPKLSPETMRNDLNDCFYAAYATLFDGLLSGDAGLVETYNLGLTLLREVFDCRKLMAVEAEVAAPGPSRC